MFAPFAPFTPLRSEDTNNTNNRIVLNKFALEVKPGRLVNKNGNYYFALKHETKYTIYMYNKRNVRCDVKLELDGEHVGSWRIPAHNHIQISRPAKVDRQFTFVDEGSSVAQSTGAEVGKRENGLIKVTFKPEKEQHYSLEGITRGVKSMNFESGEMPLAKKKNSREMYPEEDCDMGFDLFDGAKANSEYSAGLTVLGGGTGQQFDTTSPLRDIDNDNITTINARLVVDKDRSGPYAGLRSGLRETPVPPPITDPDHQDPTHFPIHDEESRMLAK